jgi:hypothetical protein
MRKKVLVLSVILIALFSLIQVLTTKVTSRHGGDYNISVIELPLYLKVINFYNRHFNYQWLAQRITGHLTTKEEKVFRLFEWTHQTILRQPENLPIMDGHVWDVYVRGYGVSDNFHDLFSTLCNYAGADAFFRKLYKKDHAAYINFTFVRVDRGWAVFNPYNGTYFINKSGDWATIDEIKNQYWTLGRLTGVDIPESYYQPFIGVLPNIKDVGFERANIQSPLNRIKFQFDQFVTGNRPLLY